MARRSRRGHSDPMRYLKRLGLYVLVLVCVCTAGAYWLASRQGRHSVDWKQHTGVTFDADGIATITASDWNLAIEEQGFVVASDRLWQMDLMRRSAAGTLSEWFGAKALDWDTKRRQEDWAGVAGRALEALPASERAHCESYAKGVNRFIDEHRWTASVEYLFLAERPAPWKCVDSLLILLSMAEDLSETIDEEAPASVWRRFLPPEWEAFLYSQDHPWNQPIFAKPVASIPPLPESGIARKAIGPHEVPEPVFLDTFFAGSNAWVHRGPNGAVLANDPHLNQSVPQLWYPVRFRLSGEEYAVGAALPGFPGLVLGRNAHVAWGFTNVGEDVDDLLEEEVSEDGKQYVASRVNGKPQWKAIEERPYEIQVRGGPSKMGTARFTHRGPVSKRAYLGDKQYSRQWLAFQPGALRIPVVPLMASKDWKAFNAAVDGFPVPAQAIVFADREGGIGLRISGRGIQRRRTGLVPQKALEGEWMGLEPVAQRPRLWIPPGKDSRFISTANQRLWTKGWGELWSTDERQDRIQTLLKQNPSASAEQLASFHYDTHSRLHQEIAQWIVRYSSPANETEKKVAALLSGWDGIAATNEKAFAHAYYAQGLLAGLAIGRVQDAFLPEASQGLHYDWKMHNAWEVRMYQQTKQDPWNAFGLSSNEAAQWVLARLAKKSSTLQSYSRANRWKAQHPFVKGVPYLGALFAVDNPAQVGFAGILRVEKPMNGASTRLVWDFKNPSGGTWAFPVGVSGHFLSKYYANFRKSWFEGKSLPAFAP